MSRIASQIKPYWELTKPDISLLVLISTFLGYFLGIKFLGESVFNNIAVLTHLMVGSVLSSAGVAILNECVWRTQSEEFWVNFKVWGLLPITFIFTAFQVPLINKYKINE